MNDKAGILGLVILLAMIVSNFIFSNYISTLRHEQAHKQIMRDFGCSSVVSYKFHPKTLSFEGRTLPVNCTIPKEDYPLYSALQSQVDNIGYQFYPLMTFQLLNFLIITFAFYTIPR